MSCTVILFNSAGTCYVHTFSEISLEVFSLWKLTNNHTAAGMMPTVVLI